MFRRRQRTRPVKILPCSCTPDPCPLCGGDLRFGDHRHPDPSGIGGVAFRHHHTRVQQRMTRMEGK